VAGPLLPSKSGCYTIVLVVSDEVVVEARTLKVRIPRGLYIYVGSGGGPGGLRARVYRHFRRRKRVRWHIDRLTIASPVSVVGVAWCEGGCGAEAESRIALCLYSMGYEPVPRFGATDDPIAPSHLFRAPEGSGVQACVRDSIECIKRAGASAKCGAIVV
jgi:Uri superfamily endonuclease